MHPNACVLFSMENVMLSIRLPTEIDTRLERLADEAGQTKSDCPRKAIMERIERIEDLHSAEQVLDRLHRGEERFVSSEELLRELEG